MASLLGLFARRLLVVACFAQIVFSFLFNAQLQDRCGGLTASEVASLHSYPIYLLSIVAAELMVAVGMVWGRLRRALFFLVPVLYVVLAYRFSCFFSLLFVKKFSCFGVLGKAASVLGWVSLFGAISGNILVFLGVY